MALAALADNEADLKTAQYRLLELWQQTYQGELLILLPDTFGTTQFLENAPGWVADWTGQRVDSKDAYVAGDEYIAWLRERGRDPRQKLLIASDALDVDQILSLHAYFGGTLQPGVAPGDFHRAEDFLDKRKWLPQRRIRFSAGWGTFLTNDFRGCNPQGDDCFNPVSLVCKLHDVEGRPAVKLSDNYAKALGDAGEVERYRRTFGTAGVENTPVLA
jgi:nicotinate phosphoribosyltransferase